MKFLWALLAVLNVSASVAMAAPADDRGKELFKLVREYAALGDHRVGTEVDARTLDWFAAALTRAGGKVERQPFTFDRFEGTSVVTVDGKAVESLPLYYEGIGDVSSDAPFVAAVNSLSSHSQTSDALNEVIAQAKASGAKIAVIATLNPLDALQIPNREPKLGSGLPVVLVAGKLAERLKSAKVKVEYHGRIAPGRSENVVATFGSASASPIILATPLSGWFHCAAERGTGIAVTIALAQRLGEKQPVRVVGTSAHELPYLGLEAYLKANHMAPRLVVHLGANVALGERDKAGKLIFAARRSANLRVPSGLLDRLRPSLTSIGLQPITPAIWPGEGRLWVDFQPGPVMSFVGYGPQFHTPLDVPETTTSPELLRRAYEGIGGTIDAFLAP